MNNGGYDIGYRNCSCFWGIEPGSLVKKLDEYISEFKNKKVLDIGCGEGKNSIYLANKGCIVEAFDISEYALKNFISICPQNLNIIIQKADARQLNLGSDRYDIIISYGLFHCLNSKIEISKLITSCLNSLRYGGIFILCAFNSRSQDLSAHKGFNPVLLSHSEYQDYFKPFIIEFESDEDLFEIHPHNNIPHTHSITRIIISKQYGFPSRT